MTCLGRRRKLITRIDCDSDNLRNCTNFANETAERCRDSVASFKTTLKTMHVRNTFFTRCKIRWTYSSHVILIPVFSPLRRSREFYEDNLYRTKAHTCAHSKSSLILYCSEGIIKCAITIGIMNKNYRFMLHITEFCGRRGWYKVVSLITCHC